MTGRAPILAIGGPTATGKTTLAVELALRTGAELVNADSRQVIRRLRVGTAAPRPSELRGVRCHLIDECEPGEPFTVADWLSRARAVLADLEARAIPAIVVGGTGQYQRALREGWDFGGVVPDPAARELLDRTASTPAGLASLAAELAVRDPAGARSVDLANPRRVVRAVEVLRAGGATPARARVGSGAMDIDLVVLDADRATHAAALEARMAAMFDTSAILSEVRAELERGTSAAALRRAGIGYAEALAVIAGELDVATARARALQRTRRYVKAQRTWFRHEPALLRLERTTGVATPVLAAAVLDVVAQTGRIASVRYSSRKV